MTTTPISSETLLAQLSWRYATKTFDPSRKIPAEQWAALERALILTPSSYGMQPYQFLVLTDAAIREKLVAASWNQRQPADCSHYVVFAARTENTETHVTKYLELTAQVRGVPIASMEGFKKVLLGDVVNGPRGKAALEWATRQTYIALGNLMTCAALLGIDTCPMEGIDPGRYNELLQLPERGFHAVVACAVGYRAASDKYATMPKVRFPAEELVVHL